MKAKLMALSAVLTALSIAAAASASTGSDHAPPKFAGLETATQCIPGPQRPHEKRPVNLSWDAARPSNEIVYEIFMAKKPGGENFAQPNWTTHKLSFTTPKLAPGRYFVVRARDRAGKEDHNFVERRAQNPCV